MAVVHGRHLHDTGQVPSGTDGHLQRGHEDAHDLLKVLLLAHAVIGLALLPLPQVDDQVDLFRGLDGAGAEDAADIDDADAPQLHKITDQFGRGTHQRLVGHPLDVHSVIGHQPVSALEQLHSGLALANAAVAFQQDALAIDLHQHAVDGAEFAQMDVQRRGQGR